MSPGRLRCAVVLATIVFVAGCGQPPDKEMREAQRAIDAAQSSGAEEYAPDELTGARDALQHARDAVTDRDYRLALSNALDSRDRAETAQRQAVELRAAAGADAEKVIQRAAAAASEVSARLKTTEGARAPSRRLADARQAMADIEQGVQEARAAFARGDYRGVTKTVAAVNERLSAVNRDLDAALAGTAAAGRR